MKKIMFNDRFGLTDAVLKGRKTVTRRIITPQPDNIRCMNEKIVMSAQEYEIKNKPFTPEPSVCWLTHNNKYIAPQYKVGEIVAISQSYEDIICGARFDNHEIKELEKSAGYTNKMFIKAQLMPHKIEILDVRVERLQDITDEDCIKEGIMADEDNYFFRYDPKGDFIFTSPREAFAELIDKVGKKGTWERNLYVFRYEFKLK